MNARELSTFLSSLSSSDKEQLLNLLQSEANDFNLVVPTRAICCPICGKVERVVKNGHRGETQRYLCKDCRKSFVANTNSILERTHKPIAIWQKFLECMTHGMSVVKSAEVCGINKNTAFVWRHKILDALSTIASNTMLDGIVEADEIFESVNFRMLWPIFCFPTQHE